MRKGPVCDDIHSQSSSEEPCRGKGHLSVMMYTVSLVPKSHAEAVASFGVILYG